MKTGVYALVDVATGKAFYIGAGQLEKRRATYMAGKSHNKAVQSRISNGSAWEFLIIKECDPATALEIERSMIKKASRKRDGILNIANTRSELVAMGLRVGSAVAESVRSVAAKLGISQGEAISMAIEWFYANHTRSERSKIFASLPPKIKGRPQAAQSKTTTVHSD